MIACLFPSNGFFFYFNVVGGGKKITGKKNRIDNPGFVNGIKS